VDSVVDDVTSGGREFHVHDAAIGKARSPLLSRPNYVYTTPASYIILYASECWAPTKADVARLDAFDQ